MNRTTCISIAALATTTLADAQSLTPTFTALGDLPGGRFESIATSISPDATQVFGQSSGLCGSQPFIWTAETGMAAMAPKAPTEANEPITIYSANGMVIGNLDTIEDGPAGVKRVTAPTFQVSGMRRQLLTNSPAHFEMTASRLGSTHLANAVSGNGAWILTVAEDSTSTTGYLWRTQPLEIARTMGDLDGYVDVTDDGTILGYLQNSGKRLAVILHASGDDEVLSALPPGWSAVTPSAISNDAQIVVGQATGTTGTRHAFLWNRDTGYRLVSSIAPDHPDWELIQAVDISADGSTLVGYGRNPDGQAEAWLITLPPLTPSPFHQWLAQYSLAGSSISEDTDADGNGNLIEFVFDSDPSKPDSLPWIADLATAFASGDRLSIPIRPGALKLVNVEVEASSDLKVWEPVTAQVENSDAVLQIAFGTPSAMSRFVRLAVQLR
ncbi:MAG: hypothetical protein R3F19_05520 [Verrucomicrobiales bacterium]